MLVIDFIEHFPKLATETIRFHTIPGSLDKGMENFSEWKKTVTAFVVIVIFVNLIVKLVTGQSILVLPPEHWSNIKITVNGALVENKRPAIRQVRFLKDAGGGFYFGVGIVVGNIVVIPVEIGKEAPCSFFKDFRPLPAGQVAGASNIRGGMFSTVGMSRPEITTEDQIESAEFAELISSMPAKAQSGAYAARIAFELNEICNGTFAYYLTFTDLDALGYSNDMAFLFNPPLFISPFNISAKLGLVAAADFQIDLGVISLDFENLDPTKTSTVVVVICILSVYMCFALALVVSGWVPRKYSTVAACGASFKLLSYISLPALLFVALVRIASYLTSASDAQQSFWLNLGAVVLVASSLRSVYEIARKSGMSSRKFFVSLLTFGILAQALIIVLAAPVIAFSVVNQNSVSLIP